MAKKAKVTHAGQEIEVELPDDFLTPDEARNRFTQDHLDRVITDRLARFGKSYRKELLADEEFRGEAMKAWGIEAPKPGEKGKPAGTPPEEAITAALKEFERTRLAPIMTELEQAKAEIEHGRQSSLISEILSGATSVGVKKAYLKPLPGTNVPAIVAMVQGAFGFDPEKKAWLAKGPDGKQFAISASPNPKAGHPYKGVSEFFTEFAKDPEYRDYLESAQQGAGLDAGRRTTAAGVRVISANDPEAFGREAENIIKGTTIVE